METAGSPELLAYPLVARGLTPDSTVIEVRGRRILAEAREETGLPIVTELPDPRDVATLVALMGKTVG